MRAIAVPTTTAHDSHRSPRAARRDRAHRLAGGIRPRPSPPPDRSSRAHVGDARPGR